MIICPHCKITGPGRPRKGVSGGKSRVVLTRVARSRTTARKTGKREWVITAIRTRQCLQCRWKWKTRELAI